MRWFLLPAWYNSCHVLTKRLLLEIHSTTTSKFFLKHSFKVNTDCLKLNELKASTSVNAATPFSEKKMPDQKLKTEM